MWVKKTHPHYDTKCARDEEEDFQCHLPELFHNERQQEHWNLQIKEELLPLTGSLTHVIPMVVHDKKGG